MVCGCQDHMPGVLDGWEVVKKGKQQNEVLSWLVDLLQHQLLEEGCT